MPRRKQVRNQKKTYIGEIFVALICALIFGACGFFLTELLFPFPPELKVLLADGKTPVVLFSEKASLFFKCFFSMTFGLLGVFSSTYYFEHFTRKQKIDEIIGNLAAVQDRLKHMIEHAALHTDDNAIEKNIISILRRKTGGVMWIAARFISKQFSTNFSMLKFDIDGDEYSRFSKKLYSECLSSIYLTSPFTPAQWFTQLYPDKADQVIKRINKDQPLKDYVQYPPPHIQALREADPEHKNKKRLVILPHEIWPSLIAQEKLLQKFIDIDIDTRFVEKETLCKRYGFACEEGFDFSRYDYAIFDKEILLKWEIPSEPNKKCPLLLVDLKSVEDPYNNEIYKKIVDDIFEFTSGQHMTHKEVLEDVANHKKGLKQKAMQGDLPHKFAYYTTGAIAWNKISNDHSYNLGNRERMTLYRLLQKTFTKEKSSWNILHIGPGSGSELSIIVDILGSEWIKKYALIDISPELLQSTESYSKNTFTKVSFNSYILDITEQNISPITDKLRETGASKNLIFLIGNGALLSNEQTLKFVNQSMKPDDRLIISLETCDMRRKEEVCAQYRLPSIINLIKQPLSLIGIEDDTIQDFIEFKYDENKSHVEGYFSFTDWIKKHPDQQRVFTNFPEHFRIFASLKPTKENLEKLLTNEGFEIDYSKDFEQEHCCGVVCRVPRR